MSGVQRFVIPGHVGLCNALRRTLLSDIETEAPSQVRIETNVTCHTDEYIAHRIGLIPFHRVGNGTVMSLHVTGPKVVTTAHFTGPAFDAIYNNIELLQLDKGHELKIEVTFDTQCAGQHARYSPCYAVGMVPSPASKQDAYIVSFGSNDQRTPDRLLNDAFDHLKKRIDNALLLLADDSVCESFI
tara:strand:+ start:122 stop:679 length:558 start_codon:yes stop_codon:yes gene_type:complete